MPRLKDHAFAVYVCSAGGREFVCPVMNDLYGVQLQYVIRSATTVDGHLYRTRGVVQPIDDGPGKPVHVWSRTGRAPLLAGGTSDGDIAMLEMAHFGLQIHHDDGKRDFDCDAGAEQAPTEAAKRGWAIVSMKDDFATVF